MSYATVAYLRELALFYGVTVPTADADCERLLSLATRDVDRYLGAAWDVADLTAEQVEALADATAAQACFRAGQGGEFTLGLDDGVAAIGGVSFSTRTPPRFSPEAADLLAGLGLFARSGTVAIEEET